VLPLSAGEMAIVAFIFLLVWGAGVAPRAGEKLAALYADRRRAARSRE
jgi:Sec-independent protein translocase protein TatA